jgi:hypothetical protein
LKSCCGTKFCFGSFLFPIFGRRCCFERGKKPRGGCGYFVDGDLEGDFVGLGWLVKAAESFERIEVKRRELLLE